MNKGLLVYIAFAFFYTPGKAYAQFNDARAYDNTPVGVSQLELSYTYVRSNASLDPSLAIAGANLDLNQGNIGYTHYFGVFHRLAWVEAVVPLAGLDGSFGPDQKWEFDAYGNASFYTDNTSYHGKEILRQEALPGLEGHISYSFNDRIWVSLDTRYSSRATTYVDGATQNNAQQNLIVGSELSISLSPQNSLIFVFAKAIVHQKGPTATGFSIKYDYTWSWSKRAAKRNRNAH